MAAGDSARDIRARLALSQRVGARPGTPSQRVGVRGTPSQRVDAIPGNPSTNIEYTISQDQVAGHFAQEESDYNLLGGSSRLHKHEPIPASHLFQMSEATGSVQTIEFGTDPGAGMDEQAYDGKHRGGDEEEESGKGYEKGRPGKDDQNSTRAAKHPRSPSSGQPSKRFKATPNELAKDESTTHEVSDENQQNSYRYHVLNRVFCADEASGCHLRVYEDEPRQKDLRGIHHLAGDCMVTDLDEFLQSREITAFVVFRDFMCTNESRASLLSTNGDIRARYSRQLVSIVSADLQDTIQRVSKFAPHEAAYDSHIMGMHLSSKLNSSMPSPAPSEYSSVFFFHHRKDLAVEAAKAAEGCALKALVSYLVEDAKTTYAKYDEMFSRRMVSAESLAWLFRPNDIVVSHEGTLVLAYVLRRFPKEGSQLELSVWNWAYDGLLLRRMDNNLTVDPPEYGEVKIDDLAVYPLQYATEETKHILLENGRRFCALSKPQLVSYEGPSYLRDYTYVSYM